MPYWRMFKFNVINYYTPNRPVYNGQLFTKMIYNKLPERILYGLLRGYGQDVFIKADVHIERSTEYEENKLHQIVKEQLNVQSLYRGEQFQIENSSLVPKKQEIGVAATDLILGIVRTILTNQPINEGGSKGMRERTKLSLELLKNIDFYSFLNNIKYFEWTSIKELSEIDFGDYLNLFLAEHT